MYKPIYSYISCRIRSAIEELQASGEILRDDLATVKDNAAHQQSELVQTRGGLAKLEKTHKNICADLQDSKARNASLQAALEDAYRQVKRGNTTHFTTKLNAS